MTPDTDGWEKRMAARARSRPTEPDPQPEARMTVEQFLATMDISVEDARSWLATPIACACVGGPPDIGGQACWCMLRSMKAQEVLRAERTRSE